MRSERLVWQVDQFSNDRLIDQVSVNRLLFRIVTVKSKIAFLHMVHTIELETKTFVWLVGELVGLQTLLRAVRGGGGA